jgi:methyl-accepting chemotaxis protein
MSFTNMSVRARLAALLVFANVFLVAAAGYAWYAISRLNTQLENVIAVGNQVESANDLARRAQLHFKVQVQEWKNMLLRGYDAELYMKHSKGFAEQSAQVRKDLKSLTDSMPRLGIDAKLAEKALAEHEELDRRYADALRAFHGSDAASAHEVDKAVRGMDRAATEHIDDIAKAVQERGEKLDAEVAKDAAAEKRLLVAGLVLVALFTIAVSAFAGTLVIAGILRRLQRATEAARTVAAGDLTAHIEVGRDDELGRLLGSLADMNRSLSGIVGRVRDTAEKVSAASTQIAAGNTDLSSRTEQQASNLEETAASIEEMTATVNQTAQNAAQANQVAAAATQIAQRGGNAVGEVVKTMDGIQASSRKIAEITGLIDSIAFQTNILALNAAVEAARAGDHGRGFAVVAGEVRSLAQRSAEAAREIKSLIGESVERVDAGAKLAGDAGQTMTEIVSSVSRVSQLIADIAGATGEQSAGIAQANTAVSELDKVTQQNAALVEESTAASESLRSLAIAMAEAVKVFRIDDAAVSALAAQPRIGTRGEPALAAPAPKPALRSAAPKALAAARNDDWKEF